MAIDLQQAMGHDLRTEYQNNSGREAFMGMAHYPAYVQWLESELRAARQKIKETEQTPTNKPIMPCYPKCSSVNVSGHLSCSDCNSDFTILVLAEKQRRKIK